MRVLMTGGAGLIGKATAERLIENGWDVRIIDIAAGVEIRGRGVRAGQHPRITTSLLEQMRGCDCVIHLAALRSPNLAPGHEMFRVNAAGTFNVFEAAAAARHPARRAGEFDQRARRVLRLGRDSRRAISRLTRHHPTYTTDPYSFSKQMIEEIGAYYWRRDGISSVALRFPGVYKRGAL